MWNNLPLVAQIIYSMILLFFFLHFSLFFFLRFRFFWRSTPFYSSFLFVFGFVLVDRYCIFGRSYCSSVWYCFRNDDHMDCTVRSAMAKAIKRSQRAANYINGTEWICWSKKHLAIVINDAEAIFLLTALAAQPKRKNYKKCFAARINWKFQTIWQIDQFAGHMFAGSSSIIRSLPD